MQISMFVRMCMGKRAREGGSEGTRGRWSKSSQRTRTGGGHALALVLNSKQLEQRLETRALLETRARPSVLARALCLRVQVGRSERVAVRAGHQAHKLPNCPCAYAQRLYKAHVHGRTRVVCVSCTCAYAQCTYIYNAQRSSIL